MWVSPAGFASVSLSDFGACVLPNRRLPSPSTTGNTISRSSSTRSFSTSSVTSCALPFTRTSPSYWSRSFGTSLATSPITCVLFQDGSESVDDTTYLGMPLNLSANSPSRDGHASANPSYVLRPSSSASLFIVSSTLKPSPSSPRSISNVQPPYLNSSEPPGSSMTPSSETNSVTT